MKEIKNKIGRFLVKKIIKWFNLDSYDIYINFKKQIISKATLLYELENLEAKENFKNFYNMDKPGFKLESNNIKLN